MNDITDAIIDSTVRDVTVELDHTLERELSLLLESDGDFDDYNTNTRTFFGPPGTWMIRLVGVDKEHTQW